MGDREIGISCLLSSVFLKSCERQREVVEEKKE